jgi:hypothetical protein
MRALQLVTRWIFGLSLGAAPGVLIATSGNERLGIGLAIIGGMLGGLLAMSSLIYGVSAAQSLRYSLRFLLWWTLAKNIPTVRWEEKLGLFAHQALPNAPRSRIETGLLARRMMLGFRCGLIIASPISIWLAVILSNEKPGEPLPLRLMKLAIFVVSMPLLFGAVPGIGVGLFTISGQHRVQLIIGPLVGAVIGCGIATATVEGAKISAAACYMAGAGVFGYFGYLFGLMAALASIDEPKTTEEVEAAYDDGCYDDGCEDSRRGDSDGSMTVEE